ncbi:MULTISPECIES: Crp/Fnr family transcriptional regulator [unclassified Oceanispirochaeta]|uniref:Crp/Fnr family transcriptional regulator n=1 Tax=unclassified Oceanispirochaeta TaxID=2635722 RepID=UPI000E0929E1|nr:MULTISPECIES: Crp/Fnr family transcriptional regulator [unclassified Oceanispirochaeta]MBF9015128.1 Crp/Fnr family transcriptional regulator [Oceanispirochaeta sp. M2]NPD71586.1 Crp/Fnr family transcriptional regulator [Oceanispirochaeta sp. M1]RDG33153.1 Crp/Fnr family transcriptional regulator [Oceanispirochaeta sp. M1]
MKIITDKEQLKAIIISLNLENIFGTSEQNHLQIHQFDEGERFIEEGSEVKYLYLVLEGEAQVAPSSESGTQVFLEYILPMDVVGDMEYFSSSPYFHNVVALTQCKYLAIPVSLITRQLGSNIHFYRFICENMAGLMKRTSTRFSRSLLFPLKTRLAKFILDQSDKQGTKNIHIHVDQVADYFAVTSRHLRRVLSELEKEEIISRTKAHIKLLDTESLEALNEEME